MQALAPLPLLLLEQVGGKPHQEVWLQWQGPIRHAPFEIRDSGEGVAAEDQGAVRRCPGPPPQVPSLSSALSKTHPHTGALVTKLYRRKVATILPSVVGRTTVRGRSQVQFSSPTFFAICTLLVVVAFVGTREGGPRRSIISPPKVLVHSVKCGCRRTGKLLHPTYYSSSAPDGAWAE
jgi:hypothetical protein